MHHKGNMVFDLFILMINESFYHPLTSLFNSIIESFQPSLYLKKKNRNHKKKHFGARIRSFKLP